VLFDRQGRKTDQIVGRSPYLQAVHIDGKTDMLGRIVDVTITKALANSLAGAPAAPPDLRISA
jgi:tRNA-2-methylthio-N6-dimethylallyladenosine synthase